jgi:hypothetical protein
VNCGKNHPNNLNQHQNAQGYREPWMTRIPNLLFVFLGAIPIVGKAEGSIAGRQSSKNPKRQKKQGKKSNPWTKEGSASKHDE